MRGAAILALAGALAVAGCGERFDRRTGPRTMDKAMSRAFKRDYAAAVRMRSGHADRSIVRHADVRCRPREPEPADEAVAWRWFCRVRFYLRDDPRARLATYGVRVDDRGCFEARTAAFPRRLPERVLGRGSPNPLVYVRSCP